jgi:hypothetical protein
MYRYFRPRHHRAFALLLLPLSLVFLLWQWKLHTSFDISTSTSTNSEDPVVIKQVVDEPVLVGVGALAVTHETRAAPPPIVHHDVNPEETSNYYLMGSTIPSATSSSRPSSSSSSSYSNSNHQNYNYNHNNTLLFVFGPHSNGQGFGSLTLNLLWIAMYFYKNKVHNRTALVVDERDLQTYRWNATHGLYRGFFEPAFHILVDRHHHHQDDDCIHNHSMICTFEEWQPANSTNCPIVQITSNRPGFGAARKAAKRAFPARTKLFGELSAFACQQLPRLRAEVQAQVDQLLQSLPLPLSDISVAFHIRRGDKVIKKESRAYRAAEYVETFVKQADKDAATNASNTISTAKHCFVATDDPSIVVPELQRALANHKISCRLWSLTPPSPSSSSSSENYNDTSTLRTRDTFLVFLAQLQVLVQAQVFVGTYRSNVGGLVALWRGCHRTAQRTGKFDHYYQSYGVDYKEWRIY